MSNLSYPGDNSAIERNKKRAEKQAGKKNGGSKHGVSIMITCVHCDYTAAAKDVKKHALRRHP